MTHSPNPCRRKRFLCSPKTTRESLKALTLLFIFFFFRNFRGWSGRRVILTIHLHQPPRFTMIPAIILFHLYDLMGCTGTRVLYLLPVSITGWISYMAFWLIFFFSLFNFCKRISQNWLQLDHNLLLINLHNSFFCSHPGAVQQF